MTNAKKAALQKKPQTIDFDQSTLTWDEVEVIEEISGLGMGLWEDPNYPKAKLMKAFAFVAAKRTNPDITIEEVGARPITDQFGDK
jgi:hypothetical protein